jgi:hypothetical protein
MPIKAWPNHRNNEYLALFNRDAAGRAILFRLP